MKIGELFVQLGVKADTFTVKDFVRAIGEIPFSVGAAITSLTGMGVGFVELFKNTLDMGNALSIFRSETGLSTDELQRWQAVAKQVGVSTDSVTSSIMGISNALAQIKLGHGESLLPFGRLGVDIRGKSPFEILQQVLSNSKNMQPNVAMALMGQLGISPEMMRLGSLSPAQFSKMASLGPVLGENDIKAMQDFQQAIGELALTLEKSFVEPIREIEPYMKDLAEALADIVILLGHGARAGLEVLHGANEARRHGVGLFSGDATPFLAPEASGKTVTVNQNVTQNIHSTADPEEVARSAHAQWTREKTKASKNFGNNGY